MTPINSTRETEAKLSTSIFEITSTRGEETRRRVSAALICD
jgi:hypothetical protein